MSKPTKEQFHAYLTVQYSGLTNMFDGTAVTSLAWKYCNEHLTRDEIVYIMQNYAQLKEEYGDIENA